MSLDSIKKGKFVTLYASSNVILLLQICIWQLVILLFVLKLSTKKLMISSYIHYKLKTSAPYTFIVCYVLLPHSLCNLILSFGRLLSFSCTNFNWKSLPQMSWWCPFNFGNNVITIFWIICLNEVMECTNSIHKFRLFTKWIFWCSNHDSESLLHHPKYLFNNISCLWVLKIEKFLVISWPSNCSNDLDQYPLPQWDVL